jgi:hypothetical protein
MVNVTSAGSAPARQADVAKSASNLEVKATASAKTSLLESSAPSKIATDGVSISTLSSRLSKAADHTTARLQGMDHNGMANELNADIKKIFYDLDVAHKATAASEVPEPNDDASAQSAMSATAFVDGKSPNPFAGLSRDQLATIAHDESGTFTVNERRAAYTQAYQEEQAWRSQVVAAGMREYNETGKMTNFFQSVLGHFEGLPDLEKATYPENYADDLRAKIKLDFNYFNHSPGDAGPTPGSIADLTKAMKSNDLDLFKLLDLGKDVKA